jgi:hypothetical protein
MRRFILAAIMPAMLLACSSGSQSVSVGQASVDPSYTCPTGSNDTAYDLHATVSVHNATSSAVTIKSVTAELTLKASAGTWAEKVGDRYDAGTANFTPSTVAAGATRTIDITVKSACTNGKTAAGGKSYGDYQVALNIDTSDGSFTSTSRGFHRIVAA